MQTTTPTSSARRFLGHAQRAWAVLWNAALLALLVGLPVALVWNFGWLGVGVVAVGLVLRFAVRNPVTALAALWVLGRK